MKVLNDNKNGEWSAEVAKTFFFFFGGEGMREWLLGWMWLTLQIVFWDDEYLPISDSQADRQTGGQADEQTQDVETMNASYVIFACVHILRSGSAFMNILQIESEMRKNTKWVNLNSGGHKQPPQKL